VTVLLEARNLQVTFDTPDGEVQAVNGVDFSVNAGETLAIVGESGSGKSQLVLSILGLLAENGTGSGEALFHGQDLMTLSSKEMRTIRGRQIAMIFQDPMTSLNPFMTIERQMTEVVIHHQKLGREQARAHAVEMLRAVRIPDPEERIRQYPHQYSGGMRQRVMIAMSLLCEPQLLIADEPTTALDVTVQAQIIRLIGELRSETNMSILLITHDLAVVADICDRIVVMYAGRVVESGTADDIFYDPRHPYTRGLLNSVPRLDQVGDTALHAIPGNPPNMLALPEGCAFRDRCDSALEKCATDPPIQIPGEGRTNRCFLGARTGTGAGDGGDNDDDGDQSAADNPPTDGAPVTKKKVRKKAGKKKAITKQGESQ
jgi:oligopeptide transport system ATP-binding protein